jgi:hypothetical protein
VWFCRIRAKAFLVEDPRSDLNTLMNNQEFGVDGSWWCAWGMRFVVVDEQCC